MACQQTKVRIAWRLVRRTRASAAPQMGWGWTAGKLSGEFDRGAGEAAIARHELRVTNCASRLALEMKWWRARQESNLYQELRKLSFYPLNYGRSAREAVLYPSLSSVHEIDQIPRKLLENPARSIGRASMTPLYNPAFACWAIRCSPPECAVLIFLCCRHQAPRYPFAGFGHEQPAGTHRRAFLPIKTPKQLIVTAILAFVVPIGIIILLVNMVVSGTKVGAGSTP